MSTSTDDTQSVDSDDDHLPDYCPHCDTFDPYNETDDEQHYCYVCYTTVDGRLLADANQSHDVDFSEDPHKQSIRPRYKGAAEHGRSKQVVLYGAFGYDPPLASVDTVERNS